MEAGARAVIAAAFRRGLMDKEAIDTLAVAILKEVYETCDRESTEAMSVICSIVWAFWHTLQVDKSSAADRERWARVSVRAHGAVMREMAGEPVLCLLGTACAILRQVELQFNQGPAAAPVRKGGATDGRAH